MNLRSLWPLCAAPLFFGCAAQVIHAPAPRDASVDTPEPADDGPAVIFDDGPTINEDDGPAVIFDDGPAVIFDDGPPVIFDDGPPVIFDDGPDGPPDIPPLCPWPEVMCGAECVATATDMRHCGGCGQICALPHALARCGAGACTVTTCERGFGNCNGVDRDGCEVNLLSDASHCGDCGSACREGPGTRSNGCAVGVCRPTCNIGWGDCNGDPRDGCEVDLTARDHCGACTTSCADGQICSDRMCRTPTCPRGMVLIPEQTFTMGEAGVAEPVHPVHLSAYCMDATEVTLAAYHTCTAPGCTRLATGAYCNEGVLGREEHPANCATWSQADAFCRAVGRRLPTEAEWEHAARGSDDRRYPWGADEPSMQLCWQGLMHRMSTCPVRSFPSGDSPFGLSDMAGNVWEWTSDWYGDYPATTATLTNPTGPATGTRRVMRGGTWAFTTTESLHTTTRGSNDPGYREFGVVGFRCASDGM